MSVAALVVSVVNFGFIAILPQIFFRKDGTFNLRWCLTAFPYVAGPVALYLGFQGQLAAWVSSDSAMLREAVASFLHLLSVGMMGLTIGTNRVPLALWHQENDAPKNIVTYGAYRYIRHPFYTSFQICTAAAAILFPHPITIAIFLYVVVSLNLTAAREERRLSASQFGEEYQEFMARTGRFLPKLSELISPNNS